MTDMFVNVQAGGHGDTFASDVRLQSVPQIIAQLGTAVFDAHRAGTLHLERIGTSLQLVGYADNLRPFLLAWCETSGVPKVEAP